MLSIVALILTKMKIKQIFELKKFDVSQKLFSQLFTYDIIN